MTKTTKNDMERICMMSRMFECVDGASIAFSYSHLTLREPRNQSTFSAPASFSSGFGLELEGETLGREEEDLAGAVSSSLLSSCFRTLLVADALVFFLNIDGAKGKAILKVATMPFWLERRVLFFS